MFDVFVKRNVYASREFIDKVLDRIPSAGLVDDFEDFLQRCACLSFTEYFFVIDPLTEISNSFDFNYKPDQSNDLIIWKRLNPNTDKEEYSGISLYNRKAVLENKNLKVRYIDEVVSKYPFIQNLILDNDVKNIEDAAIKSKYAWFYLAEKDTEILRNFNFEIEEKDFYKNKVFLFKNREGIYTRRIRLGSKAFLTNKEYVYINKTITDYKYGFEFNRPYDVIFLSYNEQNADKNYEKLKQKAPHAKRINGVKGIFNAHKAASEIAETPMFFVVDADTEVVDDFTFDYPVDYQFQDAVYVWRSRNPVNDLVYGYGGVKLFPTATLRDAREWKIDFTTSLDTHFMIVNQIGGTTAFNTDPFSTWRSAFRECVKLSSKIIDRQKDEETEARLDIWCSVGADRPFGEYCISGARMGREYGSRYKGNAEALSRINDFEWLREQFETAHDAIKSP